MDANGHARIALAITSLLPLDRTAVKLNLHPIYMLRRVLCLCVVVPGLAFAETATDLFSDLYLHDIYLEMRPGDWQALRDNYLQDTKYEAAFTWNTVHFAKVSVRSRGSSSRDPVKPSLKIDF